MDLGLEGRQGSGHRLGSPDLASLLQENVLVTSVGPSFSTHSFSVKEDSVSPFVPSGKLKPWGSWKKLARIHTTLLPHWVGAGWFLDSPRDRI